MASSRSSITSRGVACNKRLPACSGGCSDVATSEAAPISPMAAVEAIMVADISELRSV